MSSAAIIMIILLSSDISIALAKNGQPRDNYSFGAFLFGHSIVVGLLLWGGFFK